jgi:hypothetical protein
MCGAGGMGTKPPKSPAARKAAKTAKKLPSAIRKRFKVRRELEEEEDRYWSEVRKENKEKKQKRKKPEENANDEHEEGEQSEKGEVLKTVETVLVTIPHREIGNKSNPKKVKAGKVNRRSEKAKQRERVNLSLN